MDDIFNLLIFAGFLLLSLFPSWRKARREAAQQPAAQPAPHPEQQPTPQRDTSWEDMMEALYGEEEDDEGLDSVPWQDEEEEPTVEPSRTRVAAPHANKARPSAEPFHMRRSSVEPRPAGPNPSASPRASKSESKVASHHDDEMQQEREAYPFDLRAAVIANAILENPYREQ